MTSLAARPLVRASAAARAEVSLSASTTTRLLPSRRMTTISSATLHANSTHSETCAFTRRTNASSLTPLCPWRSSSQRRTVHTTSPLRRAPVNRAPAPPRPVFSSNSSLSSDDGSNTPTDLSALNVLANVPVPSTSIDACLTDGFHLNSGTKITGGAGVLLVAGEAFAWRPWLGAPVVEGEEKLASEDEGEVKLATGGTEEVTRSQWAIKRGRLIDRRGVVKMEHEDAWGLLKMLYPKPDLLIIGVGSAMRPISPATRRMINDLGISIDVQDTRNAAAQFNLLATERGVQNVAAAMLPLGI